MVYIMNKEIGVPAFRSQCPVAASLDLLGDKWSLVVVRDLMIRKRRYKDFQDSPEGIPTNILANRLRKLEEDGIIKKHPYQEKPVRYEYSLTRKGADLLPVLQQLALWGNKHIPESWSPPDWFLNAKPDDLPMEK
jgi:DNA-binding HxlR family transcriptional regulator